MRNDELEIRKTASLKRLLAEFDNQPFVKKKDEVVRIEQSIRNLVGSDPESLDISSLEKYRNNLLILLDERRTLMNWMFQETTEEIERMKVVNSRLFELTKELRLKMADVCEALKSRTRDAFDDDFELKGTLRFCYNGEESVLSYPGDDIYGSDYRLMIATNNYLTGDDQMHYLELRCRYDDTRETILQAGNCDDDFSWAHDTPGVFDGIYICHTTAIFCRDFGYPIQDVLHLNDFWNEVHVRYQHFATQDSKYKYPRD